MLRIGFAQTLFAAVAFGQPYTISTVAGVEPVVGVPWLSMPALQALFSETIHPAIVDDRSNLYLASRGCVFRLDDRGIVTRVAGTGVAGYAGDGGLAISAQLIRYDSGGIAVDRIGNLYIADGINHRIRKVSSTGVITTVAGTGRPGYSGDGGPATSAQLSSPAGIAVDSVGSLYIADFFNYRIRKISPDGIITTVAGNGRFAYSGDGGPATKAQLSPDGLAFDSRGSLYIADVFNYRIRKISPDGIITTVAGDGTQGYSGDGGSAAKAQLDFPDNIAVDRFGNLYISDTKNITLRKVSPDGIITSMGREAGVAVDGAGAVYFGAYFGYISYGIVKLSADGLFTTVVGFRAFGEAGDGGPATEAKLFAVRDVALDSSGTLYLVDAGHVRRVSADGIIDGVPVEGLNNEEALSVFFDSTGSMYVTTLANCSVTGCPNPPHSSRAVKVSAEGAVTVLDRGEQDPPFLSLGPDDQDFVVHQSGGVAVDGLGNVYLAQAFSIYSLGCCGGLAFDQGGVIRRVSSDGTAATVAGAIDTSPRTYPGDDGPATSAFLRFPSDVALDAAGNLYIADAFDHRIRKVSPDGIITTFAGNGTPGYSGDGGPATKAQLKAPTGIALDSFGSLYIADSENARIRKVSPDGIITTLEYSGDGGAATKTQLIRPIRITVDQSGQKIYVADSGNDTVRLIQAVQGR